MNRIALIVAGTVIALVLGIVYFTVPGKLAATVDPESPFQDGINLTTSADNFAASQALPATLSLKAGSYELIFSSADPNAQAYRTRVRIWPGITKKLPVIIEENDLPGVYEEQATPYLEHFPHETNDYRLEAETATEPEPKIIKIKLTVLHRFAGPDDPDLYQQEHDLAVEAAKAYLREKGVPESIPVEIFDL